MPSLLLFAATTGYQTRSFVDAAKSLGVEVILATDRCHVMNDPWGDKALAVRFDEPVASVARAAAELSGIVGGVEVAGVIAVADRPTLVAALVANHLHLPWHPPAAAAVCRDKHRMRALFRDASLPVPAFCLIPLNGDPAQLAARTEFPCVLKPLSMSGSRGVIRANTAAEFVRAFDRIRKLLTASAEIPAGEIGEGAAIQIESYIPGREFALEGVMNRGELQTLAIFDKPDPLEGPFFEETLYVTPSREPQATRLAIMETTARAAHALGLWHGPVHAEMRVNTAGVFMLEIAARPIGGLCSRVLRFQAEGRSATLTLEELLILHAIGAMPAGLRPAVPAAGVMMIPVPRPGILQSVSGVEDARAVPGIEDVAITARPGERLVPLPEGASYTGFIFAAGEDARTVEESLREAHGKLRFDILSALDVLG